MQTPEQHSQGKWYIVMKYQAMGITKKGIYVLRQETKQPAGATGVMQTMLGTKNNCSQWKTMREQIKKSQTEGGDTSSKWPTTRL